MLICLSDELLELLELLELDEMVVAMQCNAMHGGYKRWNEEVVVGLMLKPNETDPILATNSSINSKYG